MSKENRLDAFTARRLFHYDPETGSLIWKWRPDPVQRGRLVGKEAGATSTGKGYACKTVFVFGRHYKAHRIIYLIMVGHFPFDNIDHLNGNALDNRWKNIRAATQRQNVYNRRGNKTHSTTGVKGVSYSSDMKKFRARVGYKGKSYFGGYHATIEEAKSARDALARRLHGEYFKS